MQLQVIVLHVLEILGPSFYSERNRLIFKSTIMCLILGSGRKFLKNVSILHIKTQERSSSLYFHCNKFSSNDENTVGRASISHKVSVRVLRQKHFSH